MSFDVNIFRFDVDFYHIFCLLFFILYLVSVTILSFAMTHPSIRSFATINHIFNCLSSLAKQFSLDAHVLNLHSGYWMSISMSISIRLNDIESTPRLDHRSRFATNVKYPLYEYCVMEITAVVANEFHIQV